MLSYLLFPHVPFAASPGVQTAHLRRRWHSGRTGRREGKLKQRCLTWKNHTFWEVRVYTSIYTKICPGARAENKESKGKEKTRVREGSGGWSSRGPVLKQYEKAGLRQQKRSLWELLEHKDCGAPKYMKLVLWSCRFLQGTWWWKALQSEFSACSS